MHRDVVLSALVFLINNSRYKIIDEKCVNLNEAISEVVILNLRNLNLTSGN